MSTTHVLFYLHGFGSSPASWKAQAMQQAFQPLAPHRLLVPALPFSPADAIALLESQIEPLLAQTQLQVDLIGSSLGGYYAIYLAERYNLNAVLINPAIRPFDLLENYLGENHNYHTGETFVFEKQHVAALKGFDVEHIERPEAFLLLLQSGDEVLDYRQALAKLPHSPTVLQQGGSHGFDHFEELIPGVLDFLSIKPSETTLF